jgi:transposase InsO family protein
MDFAHMPEKDGCGQVLIVVDRFTKFTILIPLKKTITAEELFHVMWERIFAVFGIPETVTSDRDKLMRSTCWMKLAKELGIRIILSTANHQRTDGQSERKIQEIQQYLRMFMENHSDWKEWLPVLQFAINGAVSTTTKETPHEATFGMERDNVWEKEEFDTEERKEKLSRLHEQMKREIKWYQTVMKNYFDKSRVEAPRLERGDRVYLRRRTKGSSNYNIPTTKESNKLEQVLLGPFEIKRKLDLPPKMKIHPIFHISLLNPTENKATEEDIDLKEFEVEKIIDSQLRGKTRYYKVRWLGYEEKDDTWEPERNLNCDEKIHEFEAANSARKSSKENLRKSASARQSIVRGLTLREGGFDPVPIQETQEQGLEKKKLRCYFHPRIFEMGLRKKRWQGQKMSFAKKPYGLEAIPEERKPASIDPADYGDMRTFVRVDETTRKARELSYGSFLLEKKGTLLRQEVDCHEMEHSLEHRNADVEHIGNTGWNRQKQNNLDHNVDKDCKKWEQVNYGTQSAWQDEKCFRKHEWRKM